MRGRDSGSRGTSEFWIIRMAKTLIPNPVEAGFEALRKIRAPPHQSHRRGEG